jgi:hypothetical protein|uniref:thiol oxidase n=1 Tax=viral metagenome TaxID=1070528 RepID=A0A6C0KT12_9ZZZZ
MSFSKEIWGSSVWNLFHTIAHKIKEDKFLFHKSNIIYIIENICNTLPCPDCSKDATAMLKKVDFAQINSKADFKLLMFNFHNAINTKLKKPLFDFNELDDKYSKANIDAIYNNLNIIYTSNSNVPQLMSSSFHRHHLFPKIKDTLRVIREDLI